MKETITNIPQEIMESMGYILENTSICQDTIDETYLEYN